MEIQRINIAESDRTLVSDFMGESFPLTVDFNHLMPVVEEIERKNFPYCFSISGNCSNVHTSGGTITGILESTSKIESVWLAVVEFIQWYNKQKQK